MSPEGNWIKLLKTDDCPIGKARFVATHGLELAVFHLDQPDRFIVTQNSCPHAGGNLSAGSIQNGQVVCPWHQWCFHLDSGQCTDNERVVLRQYPCRVTNGDVEAILP